MKKKVLFSLMALVVMGGFSTLQAKVVDYSEAIQVATNFLRVSGVKEVWNSNNLTVSGVATMSTTETPTFYVFAPETGKGFVIVSADDSTLPILGYSLDQQFVSNEELPCNLRWWCETMNDEITRLRNTGEVSARKANQSITPLADNELLLETALWNQSAPYYNDCPLYNGSHCVTGCGPTATAEAMRYHNYPEHGEGQTEAYTTSSYKIYVDSRDLSSHDYDWGNMLIDYSNGYTDAQASAVALLMADLGAMYQADYGTGGTGIYVGPDQVAKLYSQFGYSANMIYEYASAYADDEWTALMKEQISTYGPVPYTGYNDSSEGHMFLIDGYQSDSYFHINWGWGGSSNGYFLLPSMEFHNGQAAILNFIPDDGSTPTCTLEIYGEGLSASTSKFETGVEFTISVTGMYNNSLITYYGEYAFVLVDKDDNIKEILADVTEEDGLPPNYYITWNNVLCTINEKIESTDCLRAAYKEKGDTEWKLMGPFEAGTIYKIPVVELDYTVTMASPGLSVDATTFYEGMSFVASASMQNDSEEKIDRCYFHFVLTDSSGNVKGTISDNFSFGNFVAGETRGTSNVECTLTAKLTAGDRIRLYYQANSTTDDGWKLVTSSSENIPWEMEITEEMIEEREYDIEMYTPGLSISANHVYRDVSFTADAYPANLSSYTIPIINFVFVLTDESHNIKEIISDVASLSNFASLTYRNDCTNISCTIKGDIEVGDRICFAYQPTLTEDDGWKVITSYYYYECPVEVVLTEDILAEQDYPLYVCEPGLSADTDVFAQNDPFHVDCYIYNNSGYTIDRSYIYFALANSEGNVKEFISGLYYEADCATDDTMIATNIPCTITSEIEVGDYICLLYQNNHTYDDGWKIAGPLDEGVTWRIEITEDNLGEPVEHLFTLYQYADGLSVDADVFYKGVEFTATSYPLNNSGETVDTYLRYALTDSEGNRKEWISDYIDFYLSTGYYDIYTNTCTINGDVEVGDHIRLFYQGISGREDTWRVMEPLSSSVPWEVEITEDMLECPVTMYAPGLVVDTDEFYTGVEFTANVSTINPSHATASVKLCLGLTDIEGKVKEWISDGMDFNVESGGYKTYKDIACAISSKIDPNDRIRLFYQRTSSDEDSWKVVDSYTGEACPVEFVITWKMITDYENDTQLRYNVLSENTVEVAIGNGDPAYHGYLAIPESVMLDGAEYTVVGISYRAFADCADLNYVEMPNTLTYIAEQAFNNCSNLLEVNFQESLTEIGDWSYTNCSALAGELIFPDNVVTIGGSAFLGCGALTSIVVGNGVTTIGASAFQGCDGVKVISLGENIETIGNTAFSGTHPEGELVIPNKVTSLGSWAFDGCSGLTSLTLGSSVGTIGEYAFGSCHNITSITTLNPVPPTLSDNAFSNYSVVLYVPAGTIDEYECAWSSQAFSNYNELDYTVLKITMADGADGYATYYDEDYDIDLSETGMTAYWAENVEGNTVTLTEIESEVVPAKTAVVLKGALTNYAPAQASSPTTAATTYAANLLHGHSTTGMLEEETGTYLYYMLTTNTSGENLGFYWGADGGAPFSSKANKAWLAVPQTSGANGLSIRFKDKDEDTTGISSVSANYGENDAIYTIQGIRVNDMNRPGVYIVNGKKILVK